MVDRKNWRTARTLEVFQLSIVCIDSLLREDTVECYFQTPFFVIKPGSGCVVVVRLAQQTSNSAFSLF